MSENGSAIYGSIGNIFLNEIGDKNYKIRLGNFLDGY